MIRRPRPTPGRRSVLPRLRPDLAASSFLALTRRALYHRVYIECKRGAGGKPPSDRWLLLLETLAAHPHLSTLVRFFDVFVGAGGAETSGFEAGFGLTGNLLASAFARALHACRNLVGVSLIWTSRSRATASWRRSLRQPPTYESSPSISVGRE